MSDNDTPLSPCPPCQGVRHGNATQNTPRVVILRNIPQQGGQGDSGKLLGPLANLPQCLGASLWLDRYGPARGTVLASTRSRRARSPPPATGSTPPGAKQPARTQTCRFRWRRGLTKQVDSATKQP